MASDLQVRKLTVLGDIVPHAGVTSIGSPNNRFKEAYIDTIYLGPNTLYLGNTPILGTDGDTILIRSDSNQSIVVTTSGSGQSKLISENGTEISTSGMNGSVLLQSTGAGGKVGIGATQQVDITSPVVNVLGILTTDGLSVNGTLSSINSTNLQITDNIITINNGETGIGIAEGQAGIKIDRGDAADYMVVYDETANALQAGFIGNLKTLATIDDINANGGPTPSNIIPLTLIANGTGIIGTSLNYSREDHIHPLPANTTPSAETINAASSIGTSTEVARADHIHAMPGTVTISTDGFMLSTDKAKLDNSTSSPTVSTLVFRDANGRFQASNPSVAQDVATKNYVDPGLVTNGNSHDHNSGDGAAINLNGASIGITGTLQVANGGTGITTIIGIIKGNGTSAFSAATAGTDYISPSGIETLSNKTLTTPTITDFTNAQHAHSSTISGGTISHTNLSNIGTNTHTQIDTHISAANPHSGSQPLDATLTALAGLISSANTLVLCTGSDTFSIGALTDLYVASANKDGIAATPSLRTLGTGSQQAAAGNHTHTYISKYAAYIGDNTSTEITITHNLATTDITVSLRLSASPYDFVYADMQIVDINNIKLIFTVAPTSGQYRVIVTG